MHFTKDHEWVEEAGGVVTIGVTAYAAEQLGDVVFIELPEVGKTVQAGEPLAVVESVKAASDIFAPLTGKVVETNSEIIDDPALVNSDAEGEGWFFRLELDDTTAFEALLDEDAYNEYLETLD